MGAVAPMLSLGAGTAQGLRRGHTGGSLTAVLAPCRAVFIWCKVVQRGLITTMPKPLPPHKVPLRPNIRLTISVTPETHEAFQWLATASGTSLGKAMGDWLADCRQAVEFTAAKVEEAKAAPGLAMRQLHSYAQALTDQSTQLVERARKERAPGGRVAPPPGGPATTPPRPVIRGGNSTGKTKGHTP